MASQHFFLTLMLLSTPSFCMYSPLSSRARVQEQAIDEIQTTIVDALAICHTIAQNSASRRYQLIKNEQQQTPLIDNSADFIAEQKVNRFIKQARHKYDPYTHTPHDWYHGLPLKVRKHLAKKMNLDAQTIKLAFPKKHLFS